MDSTIDHPTLHTSASGPLEGVRVLTLENLVAGPLTTMLLADWGAEVIKIEPVGGDLYRSFQPVGDERGTSSYSFARVNRNKKSVRLDLRSEQGRERFIELAGDADVVVQNLRPGALVRLGLGYDTLSDIYPEIILVSLSGFGQQDVLPGPYASMPALDLIGLAMSGLGLTSGDEGDRPRYLGFPLIDTATGDWGAIGALLALRWRDLTGQGQHVDIAMYDVAMHLNEYHLGSYANSGILPPRGRLGSSAPFDFYEAANGWFALAVTGEAIWQRLCLIMGRRDLAEDPDLNAGDKRAVQSDRLRIAIERWSRRQTVDEICRELTEAGVPASPVQDAASVFGCPHARKRKAWVSYDDPVLGEVHAVASPVRSNVMPSHPVRRAPMLGEHQGWSGLDKHVGEEGGE